MSLIWALIVWTVFGFVCGAIGRLLVPGKQAMGCATTIALGVVGSFIGGFIAYAFTGGEPLQASGFILSIIGSALAVLAYVALTRKGEKK